MGSADPRSDRNSIEKFQSKYGQGHAARIYTFCDRRKKSRPDCTRRTKYYRCPSSLLALRKDLGAEDRCYELSTTLTVLNNESRQQRYTHGLLFRTTHIQAFANILLNRVSKGATEPFSFIASSRSAGFSASGLSHHLEDVLTHLTPKVSLWNFVVPLLSSALLLASYPPGAHCKQ